MQLPGETAHDYNVSPSSPESSIFPARRSYHRPRSDGSIFDRDEAEISKKRIEIERWFVKQCSTCYILRGKIERDRAYECSNLHTLLRSGDVDRTKKKKKEKREPSSWILGTFPENCSNWNSTNLQRDKIWTDWIWQRWSTGERRTLFRPWFRFILRTQWFVMGDSSSYSWQKFYVVFTWSDKFEISLLSQTRRDSTSRLQLASIRIPPLFLEIWKNFINKSYSAQREPRHGSIDFFVRGGMSEILRSSPLFFF